MKQIIHVGVNECSVSDRIVEIEDEMRPRRTLSIPNIALLRLIIEDAENEVEHDGLIYGHRHDGGSEIVIHQRRRVSAQDRILRHPKAVEAFAERAWSGNS